MVMFEDYGVPKVSVHLRWSQSFFFSKLPHSKGGVIEHKDRPNFFKKMVFP
jgi:hypothetical protein